MKFMDFMKLEYDCLMLFEKYYQEEHLKNEELYPLEISNNNVGIWAEMLEDFKSDSFSSHLKSVLE